MITLAVAILGLVSPPAADAAEVPWSCDTEAYLFQSPNGLAAPHTVDAVDLVTGTTTRIGTTVDQINAVAYNLADNYTYAWNTRTSTLNRVSSDLSLINLGIPTGTPTAFRGIDYNVGETTDAGRLFIMDNQSGRWLDINLIPGSPSYNSVGASGIMSAPAGLILPGDLAEVGGTFYGVAPTTSGTGPARLVAVNPTTHAITNLGPLNGTLSGSTFGAIYSDGRFVYASRNQGGAIYRIDPTAVTATQIATGPAASSNDGARCRDASIPTITLVKQVDGRLVSTDQFLINLITPTGDQAATATTTGTQTTVSTAPTSVERGQTYTITDQLTDESPSNSDFYSKGINCVTNVGGIVGAPPPADGIWTVTVPTVNAINAITCTITNQAQAPNPEITLTKSVDPSDAASFTVGQVLTYSFVVANTGNQPITDVTVNEVAFSGSNSLGAVTCPGGTLDPGLSVTCTATYTLTQDDIDAGEVTNTAQATGNDPGGDPVPSNPDDAEVPGIQTPELTLAKTVDPEVVTSAGEQVTYTYKVINTGNVTLNNLNVVDIAFTGTGTAGPISCPVTRLVAGEITECTSIYTTTQSDIDAGGFTNTAEATGTPPGGGTTTSNPDDAEVIAPAHPHLTLSKTVDPTTVTAAGETVNYTFDVTNDGNVTITNMTIDELAFSGTGDMSAITCGAGAASMAPADTVTCTAAYTVTPADITATEVTNTARATGTPPGGGTTNSDPDDAIVGVIPIEALELVKTADPATVTAAGDTVTYTYAVTNTGTATVTDVTINEITFTGTGTPASITCGPTAASLAPDATVTCTGTYTTTQADIDAGLINNTAQAGADGPSGNPLVSNEDDAIVTAAPDPALTLDKTADPATITSIDDPVTYTYLVTNTGNVTLTDITITELTFTGTGDLPTPTCGPGAASLAPADTVTCTTTYIATADDEDAGLITNTARADGTPPGGGTTPSDPDDATVVIPPPVTIASIELDKTAAPATVTRVGETITYTFTVHNDGTVPLSDITIDEGTFTGTGTLSAITCPQTTLAIDETIACEATYKVTTADLAAEIVSNTATATGTPPGGNPTESDPSTAEVTPPEPVAPVTPPTDDDGNDTGNGFLPNTGAPAVAGYVGLAALLILAGAAVILTGRRNHTPAPGHRRT